MPELELVEIQKEIYQSSLILKQGSSILFDYARSYAQAQRDYKIALAKAILDLKDEKMNITLIPDLAKGRVSEELYMRDLAELTYKSAKDRMDAIQAQMNGLQTISKFMKEVEGNETIYRKT